MDYITLRDPADYTEEALPDDAEYEPVTADELRIAQLGLSRNERERRLHKLYHELKYWRDDLLLGERALTDPDHGPHHQEIRERMERGRIEVERLEFEIRVAEIKGEVETNKSTIELHEDGLRQCNKRIGDLLSQLDDVRNEREYRQSDEHKAGLSFTEWNRRQFEGAL
jgi:chromosome segregation ATPase